MEEEKKLTDEEFQKLSNEDAVKQTLPEDESPATKDLPDEEEVIDILHRLKEVIHQGPDIPKEYLGNEHIEEPEPFSNREIKYHRVVNNKPEKLIITANAPEDPGGAPDGYLITHIETTLRIGIDFQTLRVKDGVTNEALLAIIKDRLVCWQAGPYKDNFNEIALESIETALDALKTRTLERTARGVEGMEIP